MPDLHNTTPTTGCEHQLESILHFMTADILAVWSQLTYKLHSIQACTFVWLGCADHADHCFSRRMKRLVRGSQSLCWTLRWRRETMTLRPSYMPCSADSVILQQPAQCMQCTCSGFPTGMQADALPLTPQPVRWLDCMVCLHGHAVPPPQQCDSHHPATMPNSAGSSSTA